MTLSDFRSGVLRVLGASASEVDELLVYNQNVFDHENLAHPLCFPLADEPFSVAWQHYAEEARSKGAFEVLKNRLMQLRFPIQEGISRREDYRAATRRGILPDDVTEAGGLILNHPQQLKLIIKETPAGRMPILIPAGREDFVALMQALTMKNEPGEVPLSMGASIVSGYNNWDRIHQYRERWKFHHPKDCSQEKWLEEFRRLIPRKELYQDRFIIISDGPYSAVPAHDMGLGEEGWKNTSLIIRCEHECTHYFTRRLYSSARNYFYDEFLADYKGITVAAGRYRADWFLRFMGLESYPHYRQGGRLENYRGDPPLSDGAFKILQTLVKKAARNLERFDIDHCGESANPYERTLVLMALTHLTLEQSASPQAICLLRKIISELREIVDLSL